MARKKETVIAEDVLAEEPAPESEVETAPEQPILEESPVGEPEADESLVRLEAAPPAAAFVPHSCPNCGSSGGETVQVLDAETFGCVVCRHVWTLAHEQAPFRRYGREGR
jgi:hypothetical protein